MDLKHIRNFSIIAHIDHGKSTLADRMLEVTGTIEKRNMKAQVLDSMDLERERGITIKMTPVRMDYQQHATNYQLNLIDTPGHIDFSYEVSRALKAVEGSILLVDSTQGVQAQTLTVLEMAKKSNLIIIPVLSKIDSPLARVDETREEIAKLLNISETEVILVSGKTGEGVPALLSQIVERIPPPSARGEGLQALVFDYKYSDHKGIVLYVRIMEGTVMRRDMLKLKAAGETFGAIDVGIFMPEETSRESLGAGEIGYIVTGIKKPGVMSVGDTLVGAKSDLPALLGYERPRPVVWASIYPESQDEFDALRAALMRLRLSDSAFSFEEESSGALGRGFRVGFLGMLHLEIITERARREFHLSLVITTPSITYYVKQKGGKEIIVYSPHLFPNDGEIVSVEEPWVMITIIIPHTYTGILMPLLYAHEGEVLETDNFGHDRASIRIEMPLREMMRNFFDELKSVTSGYASISYEILDKRPAEVTRLDIYVANEIVPAFSRVVSKRRVLEEGEKSVEKLHSVLPRQQFETKIQAYVNGRIISSQTVKAFRKDVLMHGSKMVGGGDVSRKKKLLEKQKRGKKRMKDQSTVNIPHEVFLKMMKSGD